MVAPGTSSPAPVSTLETLTEIRSSSMSRTVLPSSSVVEEPVVVTVPSSAMVKVVSVAMA